MSVQDTTMESKHQTEATVGKAKSGASSNNSVLSKSSGSRSNSKHLVSSTSSIIEAATRARASAEATKAKVAFAKKQLELKEERARLDAQLEALELEKEAAAAEAKAEVLEAAVAEEHDGFRSVRGSVSPEVVRKRTEEYVQNQKAHSIPDENPKTEPAPHVGQDVSTPSQHPAIETSKNTSLPVKYEPPSSFCPPHPSGTPNNQTKVNHPYPSRYAEPPPMVDFAKFLARRELVTTGLFKFDDTPESYRSWHSSFLNAIEDLDLTYSEELHLLVKWLGKESSEHVRRIRAAYATNPQAALQTSWDRLRECYATPEVVDNALFGRLDSFPCLSARDNTKLRELSDLLLELLAAKNENYLPGLAYLDTPRCIKPIVEKLPPGLQEKWLLTGSRYKKEHGVMFPPFYFFVDFIYEQARARNDPSFTLPHSSQPNSKGERVPFKPSTHKASVSVHRTEIAAATDMNSRDNDLARFCPIHKKTHRLVKCRAFRAKPLTERKSILKENRRCFQCCSPAHVAKNCQVTLKCDECESNRHCSAMHPDEPQVPHSPPSSHPPTSLEPEREPQASGTSEVTARCTAICSEGKLARSCSKICLVRVFPQSQPEHSIKLYAILDDQSNRSLACSEFFEHFDMKSSLTPYLMRTCSGTTEMIGREAVGFQVEAANGGLCLNLPPLIECSDIAINRNEIPAPEVALAHRDLRHIAPCIPKLDPDAQMVVLLGRDAIRMHKVREYVNGPHEAPYAQRLDLGWVIVGEVCIDKAHKPTVSTFRTHILHNGRPSLLTPCHNAISVKAKMCYGGEHRNGLSTCSSRPTTPEDKLGNRVFECTEKDNKCAMSFEDESFLRIMEEQVHQDEMNNWVAPLPFKSLRLPLPNNKDQAASRLNSLRRTLNRNTEMKQQFCDFMHKLFNNNHAEIAPPVSENTELWYLPMFGVYHPQKPGQICVVFDSSAQQQGVSLNSVLLTGPDLNNTLLGVLLRFRKEAVAITGDIQQMFYGFLVSPDHRDDLRFLWHKENDLRKEVQEYRMRVHVFGNAPSPAVAIYCLRRAAQKGESKFGKDTRHFVERHFYVDDGLISLSTESAAIDLLRRTCASLAESNLKLHKIASNSVAVMRAFQPDDLATNIKDLSLGDEILPAQRSLGLSWDINTDTFTFKVTTADKPYTRRGVLSVINSIFDPLGLAAPVTIQGRRLLRELASGAQEWDTPLPSDKMESWEKWRMSLQDLSCLHVPRCYVSASLSKSTYTELCIFSDASSWAIAAATYLRTISEQGQWEVRFVLGKAKLAPQPEPTIPRLELCGAVLAVEIAELILDELDYHPDAVKFYSDSKVVLGYISNDTKRFYVYVHNRVRRIRQTTSSEQWHYVTSEQNPADLATRSVPANQLMDSMWLKGPPFLFKPPESEIHKPFELVDPENDAEVRRITTLATRIENQRLTSKNFQNFSTWTSLLRAISFLMHQARSHKLANPSNSSAQACKGWHCCTKPRTPEDLEATKELILQIVQRDAYPDEYASLQANKEVSSSSKILNLDPYMSDGLIRVGGRLRQTSLKPEVKYPVILPSQHHVSKLLASHYHEEVKHQGRQLTEGAVRAAGFWIITGKRLVTSIIHHCVTCRKLRGKQQLQKMADLPPERLDASPPFSFVGLDVFGPWKVVTRRTRGGAAESKRWAILFTCMSTRSVHIEVIESMDTSSCVNALQRFFAIRGPAKQLWSDRGTNFVAASSELDMGQPDGKGSRVLAYLHSNGCTWKFNPPYASHMGGVWERMIGTTRKILDSMLLQNKYTRLTHEVLCTLMAEVSSIINARPLVPVSSDPSSPFLLSPAMLLTQKPPVFPPPGQFTGKDLLKSQWKQVQALANEFWNRWRNEYISTLNSRRKWHKSYRNLQPGDVVLLKQAQANRNEWPMAVVTATFPSNDGKVRKIEVRTSSQGNSKTFLRPISEVILLLETEQD